jgi:hypothetical protein
MVKALALAGLVVAVAGCFDDVYSCKTNDQCDVGDAGRCELDGFCTHFDPTCETQRRYSDHAGALTNVCFDDRVEPINACAGGQPPTTPTGCYADVCARLPACCSVGWSDACAQVAQEVCTALKCDTRIAVNASRSTMPGVSDRFQLIWDGTAWTIVPEAGLGAPLAWVGPKPGDGAPRLAYTMPGLLVVEPDELPVAADHTYNAIASVGFDRDGRDTIAAAFSSPGGNGVEIWNVTTKTSRSVNASSERLAWGDTNRDGFPDAVNANTGTGYAFLENIDDGQHSRSLSSQATANVSGGTTPGAPALRAIEWLDFDGDTNLDLAVFGTSVRVHTRASGLNDQSQFDLDCDPPSTAKACSADPEPDLEQTAFVGAAFPTASGPSLLAGIYPDRKLFRVQHQNGAAVATQLPFPNDTCTCVKTCSMTQCPGPNCSCTYDCNACQSILAIATRDLDGDHALDIIAIDGKLRLYTATAASGFTFGSPTALISPLPALYTSVDISMSGALIP